MRDSVCSGHLYQALLTPVAYVHTPDAFLKDIITSLVIMCEIDVSVAFEKREQVESSKDMTGLVLRVPAELRKVRGRQRRVVQGEDRGVDIRKRRIAHVWTRKRLDAGVGTQVIHCADG